MRLKCLSVKPSGLVGTLADFASSAWRDRVPASVLDDAALRLLDVTGLCLCVNRSQDSRRLNAELEAWGELGSSTVIGFGAASAPAAALANGIMSHAEDFDDTHTESLVHVSSGVVPAALAVAEERRTSGADLLAAIAMGHETSIRIGLGAQGQFHARGFHATGITGPFGATVAAGLLMGLPAQQIANALSIAASMSAGLLEFLADGSTVKRVHPGWAAHSGILAARLARAGLTGPASALEGRYGLYRTHVEDAFVPDVVVSDLGCKWHALDTSFKPYPCCNFLHAPIDAIARLQLEHGFAADDVESLICELPAGAIPVVAEPEEVRRHPRSGYDAKFSVYFALAAQLVEGRVGLATFEPTRLEDAEICRLMPRIACRADPDSDRYPASFGGKVALQLRNGTRLARHEPYNRGGPFSPMTQADVIGKFEDNARLALDVESAGQLSKRMLGIGNVDDVREVSSSLRAARPVLEAPTR